MMFVVHCSGGVRDVKTSTQNLWMTSNITSPPLWRASDVITWSTPAARLFLIPWILIPWIDSTMPSITIICKMVSGWDHTTWHHRLSFHCVGHSPGVIHHLDIIILLQIYRTFSKRGFLSKSRNLGKEKKKLFNTLVHWNVINGSAWVNREMRESRETGFRLSQNFRNRGS